MSKHEALWDYVAACGKDGIEPHAGERRRAFDQAVGFQAGQLTEEFGSPVQEFRLEAEAWQIS